MRSRAGSRFACLSLAKFPTSSSLTLFRLPFDTTGVQPLLSVILYYYLKEEDKNKKIPIISHHCQVRLASTRFFVIQRISTRQSLSSKFWSSVLIYCMCFSFSFILFPSLFCLLVISSRIVTTIDSCQNWPSPSLTGRKLVKRQMSCSLTRSKCARSFALGEKVVLSFYMSRTPTSTSTIKAFCWEEGNLLNQKYKKKLIKNSNKTLNSSGFFFQLNLGGNRWK